MQATGAAHSKSLISGKATHRGCSPARCPKGWQRRGILGLQRDKRITVEEVPLQSKADLETSAQSDSTRASGTSTARSIDSLFSSTAVHSALGTIGAALGWRSLDTAGQSGPKSASAASTARSSSPVAHEVAKSPRTMLKPLWGRSMEPPEERQLPPTELDTMLEVSIADGQTRCNGLYELLPGMRNGQPIWIKRRGRALWLFCSPSGRWCIAGKDVQQGGFRRTAGFIAQTARTGSVIPPECTTAWQQWRGGKFVVDESIAITYATSYSDPDPVSGPDANDPPPTPRL